MESKVKEAESAEDAMRVRRLAISYEPPLLVVEAVKGAPPTQKLQHYRIKLKRFSPSAVSCFEVLLPDACFSLFSRNLAFLYSDCEHSGCALA